MNTIDDSCINPLHQDYVVAERNNAHGAHKISKSHYHNKNRSNCIIDLSIIYVML